MPRVPEGRLVPLKGREVTGTRTRRSSVRRLGGQVVGKDPHPEAAAVGALRRERRCGEEWVSPASSWSVRISYAVSQARSHRRQSIRYRLVRDSCVVMVRFSLVAVIWLGAPLFAATPPAQRQRAGDQGGVQTRRLCRITMEWLQEMVPIRWMTR